MDEMDTLIALPVAGESFLLRRSKYHVLVDGGYNPKKLAEALRANLDGARKLDIVVCTHADRDHAGGLAKLIDEWGGKVGEFWLPGKWVHVIPELIELPQSFIDGLVAELDTLINDDPDEAFTDKEPEELDATFSGKQALENERKNVEHSETTDDRNLEEFVGNQFPPDGNYPDKPGWLEELYAKRDQFEQLGIAAQKAFDSGKRKIRYRQKKQKIGKAIATYWLGLIETADSIRGIAEQAIKHDVPIRWFDYGAFATTRVARGGYKDFLEPLNAVEQLPPPPVSLRFIARLSPVNEECLAFLAPPSWGLGRLGVVFCGDSPLGDGRGYADSFLSSSRRLDGPVVATAPHHGSEHNAIAYKHLNEWADVTLWMRTGGSILQPGARFKAIDPLLRVCTHCPQSRLKLQKASVRSLPWYGPFWPLLRVSGHDCSCT